MNPYEDEQTNVPGPAPVPHGRPIHSNQRSAIAAAVVGTGALGAAAAGMSMMMNDDEGVIVDETPEDPKPEDPRDSISGETTPDTPQSAAEPPCEDTPTPTPPVAPPPHEQTFNEAFAAARSEQGAGHYFEWHGQLYNTYFNNEWEGMSHHQQQQFLATVPHENTPHDDIPGGGHSQGDVMAHAGEIPPAIELDNDDGVCDDNSDITIDDSHGNAQVGDMHTASHTDQGSVSVDTSSDTNTGRIEEVGVIDINGHEISVYDANHDGHADMVISHESHVALIDTNNDHTFDTGATFNTDTHELTDAHSLTEDIAFDIQVDYGTDDDLHADTMLTSNDDFGGDFNNNDDISDYTV